MTVDGVELFGHSGINTRLASITQHNNTPITIHSPLQYFHLLYTSTTSQVLIGNMTTLDHRFYPHILDLIFEAAPRMSLFALRTASHALHDRADHALAKHLSISIHPAIRGQVPTSTIGDSDSDDSHSENGYQDSRTQILGLELVNLPPIQPPTLCT
jgi:hypothetical protein